MIDPVYHKAIVRVTRKCNLGCPDCKWRGEHGTKSEMSWEDWLNIVTETQKRNVQFDVVLFTGGEPTLWPRLPVAIGMVKGAAMARHISVVTNAVKRNVDITDYGDADAIHISEYGAINRWNILRLKRQNRRRVHVHHVVHVPTDVREAETPLPAVCECVSMFFSDDKVYPCSVAAQYQFNGCHIKDDFVAHLRGIDPLRQDACKTCFNNRRNRSDREVPFVFEWYLWESSIGHMIALPWRLNWLRRVYRKVRRRK